MTLPPYAVMVGDVRLPKPVAGHPALELCNTVAGWADEVRHDWFAGYDTFAAWAEFTGLVDSAAPLRARAGTARAAGVLADVRSLRGALYRVLAGGATPADAAEVAARADEANAVRRLTFAPDGSATFRLPPGGDLRLPLHAVALAAVDLLGRAERTAVRACPGHGCGWLFLDPRGRRVWCSMASCGNRAKVRAYAARRHS